MSQKLNFNLLPKLVKSNSYLFIKKMHGFNFGGTSSLHFETSMITETHFFHMSIVGPSKGLRGAITFSKKIKS